MRLLGVGAVLLALCSSSFGFGSAVSTTNYTCQDGSGKQISHTSAVGCAAEAAASDALKQCRDGLAGGYYTSCGPQPGITSGCTSSPQVVQCTVSGGLYKNGNYMTSATGSYYGNPTGVPGCALHASKNATGQCNYDEGFRAPPPGTQNGPGGVSGGTGSESTDGVPYSCTEGSMKFNSGYGPVPTVENAMAPKLTCMSGAGSAPGSAAAMNGGCQLEFKADSAKCGAGMTCYGVGTDTINGKYCENKVPVLQGQGRWPVEDKGTIPYMPPVAPCGVDTCPGTVNGNSVCVACNSNAAPGAGTGASAPAGQPLPPIPNAPPGAVGSQDQTTCNASGCSTTTTWFGPTGAVVGTTVKDAGKPANSFCTDNPSATICKKSTYAGNCGAVACDGDAVQCAIAKEQSRRNCELWDSAPGNHPGVLAANGQAQPAGHPGAAGVDVPVGFASVLDTSNGGLSASCLGDETFAVGNGSSVTIPWSRLCAPLNSLGIAIQGIALLWAVFIAFKT